MKKIQSNSFPHSGYTRVTEVLSPFSGMDKIPKHIVENAGRRGTLVHTIIEGIVSGLGTWGSSDETKPYIDSFMRWWNPSWKIISQEQRYFCDVLLISGQIDLIVEIHGEIVIVDYKTSYKPSKTWILQGSAYAYLARLAGHDIKKMIFLHLQRDGSPPVPYTYTEDFETYKKCLECYRYFNPPPKRK